jgi:hypothetical protein
MEAPQFELVGRHQELFDEYFQRNNLTKATLPELEKMLEDFLYMTAASVLYNNIIVAQGRAIFARAIEREIQQRKK